ncbi:MAG: NtrZ family periplasmic regulatory protein [Caulobacteraceae bacterium]
MTADRPIRRAPGLRPGALAAALATAGLLAAGAVHAQMAPASTILVANDFSGGGAAYGSGTTPRRTLEWDARRGRWGLRLGVEQHVGDTELQDLQPGVYYRITPRLHIGGGVSLVPGQMESQRLLEPQLPAPRVRLETTFKF